MRYAGVELARESDDASWRTPTRKLDDISDDEKRDSERTSGRKRLQTYANWRGTSTLQDAHKRA
jgi:hypothetical protein